MDVPNLFLCFPLLLLASLLIGISTDRKRRLARRHVLAKVQGEWILDSEIQKSLQRIRIKLPIELVHQCMDVLVSEGRLIQQIFTYDGTIIIEYRLPYSKEELVKLEKSKELRSLDFLENHEKNLAYYQNALETLSQKYPNRYIAIIKEWVIESAEDPVLLERRMDKEFPNSYALILPVPSPAKR